MYFDQEKITLILTPTEDFWGDDFQNLLPGDIAEGKVKVTAGTASDLKVYFSTAQADGGAAYEELLGQLQLRIALLSADGSGETAVLYQGKANGTLDPVLVLDALQGGKTTYLLYLLTIPSGLDNRYQDALGKVKWVFSCEAADTAAATVNKPAAGWVRSAVGIPATGGARINLLIWSAVCLFSALAYAGLRIWRKKQKVSN